MNTPFARKVAYAAAIAVLLFPLFLLGQPAGGAPDSTDEASNGGKLAQLRAEHRLAQVSLGEIDAASESIRLATLGLRGVAANLLWHKAQEFDKTENWEALSATLMQITKLQPNFLKVWDFQAHNLSYNVSVEFDNYRHRYHWVKKGIDFLIEGTSYNRDEPKLLHQLGWYTGQKLGRADEKVEFRELYRKDSDWHTDLSIHIPGVIEPEVLGPEGLFPDNWLTGRLWYLRAEDAVDNNADKVIRGTSPLVFHADRPKSRINYAMAIQDEGYFQQAMDAWRRGGVEWTEDYGSRNIPSTWGISFQLREREEIIRQAEEAREELDRLAPGVRERMEAKALASLSDEERELLDAPRRARVEWREEQWNTYLNARERTRISDFEVAREAPENVRGKARLLSERIKRLGQKAGYISRYRSIVNYEYWATRAEAEQTKLSADARELLFTAGEKYEEADLEGAQADYELAWDKWDEVFRRWPELKAVDHIEDLKPALEKYRRLLNQQNKPDIPADFKLAWLLDPAEIEALQVKQQQAAEAGALDGAPGDKPDPEPEPNEPVKPSGPEPAPSEPEPSDEPEPGDEPSEPLQSPVEVLEEPAELQPPVEETP